MVMVSLTRIYQANFLNQLFWGLGLEGIWDPKIGNSGKQLPNVRVIRNIIVTDKNYPAVDMTHMLMQWGQFVNHDMIRVPSFRTGKHKIK
jgi:hypothetical protein